MKAIFCMGLGVFTTAGSQVNAWAYRDDIGAYWGVKGYEEQVTEVGTHRGHMGWP